MRTSAVLNIVADAERVFFTSRYYDRSVKRARGCPVRVPLSKNCVARLERTRTSFVRYNREVVRKANDSASEMVVGAKFIFSEYIYLYANGFATDRCERNE